MIVSYPAIIRRDQEDPSWWNVSIPDVWGAVTCGTSFENAVEMGRDLLKTLSKTSKISFGAPTPIEETKANFEGEIVVPIEVDLPLLKEFSDFFKNRRPPKRNTFVTIGDKNYEVVGSLTNYYSNRIFVVDKNHKRLQEIMGNDNKYFLLQMIRNEVFSNLLK